MESGMLTSLIAIVNLKKIMEDKIESESVNIAKEVFGVEDSDIKGIEDYIALADIMISILNYTPEQVKQFIIRLSKLKVGIDIDRKLPEDCVEVVDKMEEILKWHKNHGYKECSPDVIVEKYNELVAYRSTLGGLAAWYSSLAMMTQLNRRNWRAGLFVTLRTFGSDMQTNIKKKTTVSDAENQAEMLNFINIKNQAYIAYVDDRLRNLRIDSKQILEGMKEILIELRHERRTPEYPLPK